MRQRTFFSARLALRAFASSVAPESPIDRLLEGELHREQRSSHSVYSRVVLP